ncbi:MAG: 2-oxoacid:ferredoxin oxidoreductase subunit beta [Geminicoccaceae bacterium]
MATVMSLNAKDYASDVEVRWCPGCGDYAIIKAVQKTLADLQADPDKVAFISGIGCAARFPYYMNTYGFHTIHGRAATIAMGAKLANPELDIWVISGDGDSLSIGGNHFMHLLRRNPDLVYLLFNNQIYGLTKGQVSPTSPPGQVTPSTPFGSIDRPVEALPLALGAGGHFIARVPDTAQKPMVEVLKRAHAYHGTGFVEILQNCIVYNDGAFSDFTDKREGPEHGVWCQHGQPLIFGKDRQLGLRFNPASLAIETVTIGADGVTEADLLVHDETNMNLASMLVRLAQPRVFGVIYATPEVPYEQRSHDKQPAQTRDLAALQALLAGRQTWTVEG